MSLTGEIIFGIGLISFRLAHKDAASNRDLFLL